MDKTKPNTLFKSIYNDSKNDIEADNYGLMKGLLHPFSDDKVLDRNSLKKFNK